MKRILIIVVVFVLLLSFCACSPPASPAEAPGDGGTGENITVQPDNDTETSPAGEGKSIAQGDEVLNAKGIRIVYTGIDEAGGPMGPMLMFDIENNMSDEITARTSDILINGSIENWPASTNIEAGKTKDFAQIIDCSLLEEYGLEVSGIKEISLKFIVLKTTTTIGESDVIVIKP